MLHSTNLARKFLDPNSSGSPRQYAISHLEAVQLAEASASDAKGLTQASFAVFCEAIAGASQNRFSWAIVKLYYSAFLTLRARLFLGEQIIFYIGNSPYSIRAFQGMTARKHEGNTHSVVQRVFKESYPSNNLFGQEIGGEDPLTWLANKRNYINYKIASLPDPNVPKEFAIFHKNPRNSLHQFFRDSSLAFDEETGIIALPAKLLSELSALISTKFGKNSIFVDKHFVDILVSEKLFIPDMSDILTCFKIG